MARAAVERQCTHLSGAADQSTSLAAETTADRVTTTTAYTELTASIVVTITFTTTAPVHFPPSDTCTTAARTGYHSAATIAFPPNAELYLLDVQRAW